MPDNDKDDWKVHRLLVLNELERNKESHDKILDILSDMGNRFGKVETLIVGLSDTAERNYKKDSELAHEIHSIEKECSENYGQLRVDIKSLKVRVGIIASAIATAIAVGARFLF